LLFWVNTKWKASSLEAEQLKKNYVQSQWDGLKSQVNLHFLFNSLNSLSALIYSDHKLMGIFSVFYAVGGKTKSRNLLIYRILFIFDDVRCGEGGIRTLDTLLAYTHFPGVLFRPLRHLSGKLRIAKVK
jgi:hypothetical protein